MNRPDTFGMKLPRTVKDLRENANYVRRLRRIRRRRELLGPPAAPLPKANMCVSVATRKMMRPGSGLMWPWWRMIESAEERSHKVCLANKDLEEKKEAVFARVLRRISFEEE